LKEIKGVSEKPLKKNKATGEEETTKYRKDSMRGGPRVGAFRREVNKKVSTKGGGVAGSRSDV